MLRFKILTSLWVVNCNPKWKKDFATRFGASHICVASWTMKLLAGQYPSLSPCAGVCKVVMSQASHLLVVSTEVKEAKQFGRSIHEVISLRGCLWMPYIIPLASPVLNSRVRQTRKDCAHIHLIH